MQTIWDSHLAFHHPKKIFCLAVVDWRNHDFPLKCLVTQIPGGFQLSNDDFREFFLSFYRFVLILRKAIHFPNSGVDFGSVVKSLRSPGKKTMAWSFMSKIVCRTTAGLWLCFQVHGSDASLRLFCRLQPRDVVPVLTSLLGLFNDVRSSKEKTPELSGKPGSRRPSSLHSRSCKGSPALPG